MDCRHQERFSAKYTETFQLNARFRKVAARFGTTSMLIRRCGIAKLLGFFKSRGIYGPIDLENHLPDGIRRYALTFDLVTNMLRPISDSGVRAARRSEPTVESLLQKYSGPVCQDLVVDGETYRVGTDHCESRYELIKPVLELYDGAFSVLDVGAAQGYFSFRIAQDYPHSTCVMAESDDTSYYAHHGSMLRDLCRLNRALPNVVHLDKRLDLADLAYLHEAEHFDVVLALLVVHLMEDTLREQIQVLNALMALGDHVVVEVAAEVGVLCTAYVEYLGRALDARYLGEVRRHKDPHSQAIGKFLWFTPPGAQAPSPRPRHDRPALGAATFARLNGAHPADFASRCS
jgi:SAM-dependent methyltransferase